MARAAAAVAAGGDPRVDPTRSGIEHVVVVMMENRSFDHMLGWLPGANGVQAGLTFQDHEGVSHSTWHLDTFQGLQYGDPDHSYDGGRTQLNHGQLRRLAQGRHRRRLPDRLLRGERSRLLLARPRRTGRCATTSTRRSWARPTRTASTCTRRRPTASRTTFTVADLPTIWDSLATAGVSARYYYGDLPFIAFFGGNFLSISSPYSQFLSDCASGDLPAVSYVDPKFVGESDGTGSDDHPFTDVRVGQSFLNDIYTAVTNGPDWDSTVLVITYDEWGGFFDHVVPPVGPDNDPDPRACAGSASRPSSSAPSPARHHIGHELFDHTSILAMIEWRWGLPPLTPRDAHALNLARTLQFHRTPDLTAPQWEVPAAATIDVKAVTGRPERARAGVDARRRHGRGLRLRRRLTPAIDDWGQPDRCSSARRWGSSGWPTAAMASS